MRSQCHGRVEFANTAPHLQLACEGLWRCPVRTKFTRSPTELGTDPIERTQRQVELSRQSRTTAAVTKRNGANGAMFFLPLMLIWLRDPMYFNIPSRWAMVAFAVSTGLIEPELASDRNAGGIAAAADLDRTPAAGRSASKSSATNAGSTSLLREGTGVTNQVGQLTQADGVWYFMPAAQSGLPGNVSGDPDAVATAQTSASNSRPTASSRIRVLENLALQRVVQMIQQDPSDNRWMISGVVTEFFSENRLMMVMAVRAPIDVESER